MSTRRRVVAGIAPADPRPELVTWAAAEARGRTATLELVTARAKGDDPVARTVLSWAASLAVERQPDLSIVTRAVPGWADQVLRAEATGADLLVIGGDNGSPFAEAIRGSVPAALLTTAPCPVVVVPKGAGSAPDTAPVVVGVDTAETSRAALDYAFAAAARGGRDLVAALCWTAPRDRTDRGADRAEAQRALSVALAGYGERYPDVGVTEVLADSDPAEELSRRSRRAALLVLGSHGRGRLASMAFGSVSRTLIRRGRCPVAVLRPNPVAAGLAS